MTEAEWLACTDPEALLRFVEQQSIADSLGALEQYRKERLFGCACCWQVASLMADERCVEAVEVAERVADDEASADDWEQWFWLTHEIAEEQRETHGEGSAAYSSACLANFLFAESSEIASSAYEDLLDLTPEDRRPLRRAWATQVVHCIWGLLPFRPLPPRRGKRRWEQERARWLAWHECTIGKLAQAIYEERAFDQLPILADALEEAGCTDAELLGHCRQHREHARGCWALDVVLRKKPKKCP